MVWRRSEEFGRKNVIRVTLFSQEKELCMSNTWSKRGKEEGDIQNGRKLHKN